MKSYLSNLNEREKWMVFSAILFVFIYVYYTFLYSPLATKVEQKSSQLIEKKETLDWMQKVQQTQKAAPNKTSLDNGQLLTLVSTQLKNSINLKFPYQLQQTRSGEIQITFDQISFNSFIEWLIHLNAHYVINMKQFDANKTDTPGIARLMVILSAS